MFNPEHKSRAADWIGLALLEELLNQ